MTTDFLQIHHASLVVTDISRALSFYQDLLGLKVNPHRPDLGYPGAWLDVGAQQIHLMQIEGATILSTQQHMGHERHLALQVSELEFLAQRLTAAGIDYHRSRSGREALFCRDPDNNTLEFIRKIR